MSSFTPKQSLHGSYKDWSLDQLEQVITDHYCIDEDTYLEQLIELAESSEHSQTHIESKANELVRSVRKRSEYAHAVDKLLQEYSLENEEGVVLMCLAEALMRIPDTETVDALIRDRLSNADWKSHIGKSDSILVNASTWGLLLTGKVVQLNPDYEAEPSSVLQRLIGRAGEPVIRSAIYQAMKLMGKQFVLGRQIKEALKNSKSYQDKGYTYSYDMLGEAAFTAADAERYFQSYKSALQAVGDNPKPPKTAPATLSIKLSALHPRYEEHNAERVMSELYERVNELIKLARSYDVGITIDAEEADRLELSLQLFKKLYQSEASKGWGNFGLVVQAYSKRALPVLLWISKLASSQGDQIPVRLVKGAYWDSEIKLSQQAGLDSYPVFTRKEGTDVSYLACARYLLSEQAKGLIFPQFATHNASTVAAIQVMGENHPYEFQRLHGMGDALYDTVLDTDNGQTEAPQVRIYAPVGEHKDLLPYLVRRLLENGANSSFVHRLVDANTPVEELTQSPLTTLRGRESLSNKKIPLPPHLFGNERMNSAGCNLTIESQRKPLMMGIEKYNDHQWQGGPIVNGKQKQGGKCVSVSDPARPSVKVGDIHWATADEAEEALTVASEGFQQWMKTPVAQRAECLIKTADLIEDNVHELMALCNREAGKSIQDCIDEIREAVDFCRYYGQQSIEKFEKPISLPGPTGESNELYYEGRGTFVCISPWNFPLAIFIGQIAAALAAGNAVICKPAEQTGLLAWKAVQLLHEAGIPANVLQLLPGDGALLGPILTQHSSVVGVAFTGSTGTAKVIHRNLADRDGEIPTLIAETGGQNAMIVDSTALPEQVVNDVIHSAFTSAGQRCSALRVLYVQTDIADRIIELIEGAMKELTLGLPSDLSTDVGPVIDQAARENLNQHIEQMRKENRILAQFPIPDRIKEGYFVPPTAVALDSISQLQKEHFGPILHIIHYKASDLDKVISDINATGFGLTLGIHSRNQATAKYIAENVRVGNVYINRNQIGAVVGVQPFGGRGLSGTGPKAGGPNYLIRFATERTRTTNTTAIGGNTTLLSLGDQ